MSSSQFSIDLSTFGPINLVVIQATSFCNLDCDYCYLPARQLKNKLSLDLIEPIFKTIFTSRFLGKEFSICWHAGEPLSLPVSFYESAFEIVARTASKYNSQNLPFFHSFQTNATYINQTWCDFFKQYPIQIGVSIDGPEFLHDAHRKNRQGTGSHASTMRGISFLQKNDIPFDIIAVITRESLDYADEIFNFFWENGMTNVGFNFEEVEGVNQSSSLDELDGQEKFYKFIERFWDLTSQTNGEFELREFEAICGTIYANEPLTQTDMNAPFVIVNFDYQGNFSTFDPELLSVAIEPYGKFILGNVLTDTLESVCQTEKFQAIYQSMQSGVDKCRQDCQYFGFCGGGAGSNKYWENGSFDSTETLACNYRIKIISDLIFDKLESALGIA